MKKITNNYYLLLIYLKITRYGYVTHKPSKSLNPPHQGGGGSIGIIWLENKIFNPKKCRGASLGAPDPSTNSGGGHTCLPVGREGRPYELINQPIRLPGLKPGVCSGLILSGAFYPDLKIGVWRRRTYQFSWLLATRQGHECFLSNRSGMSEKRIEVIGFGIDEDWSIP
jgi:hypothetical protein